ncbi:MAG: phenylacetate-CoA ligase [Flavobacteriales bacterium]
MNLFKTVLWLKGYPLNKAQKLLSKKVKPKILLATLLDSFKGETPIVAGSDKSNDFIIEKSFLRDYYRRLESAKGLYRGKTSGSSGTPLQFVKSKLSHAITWQLIDKTYARLGLSPSDKQARFYGMPKSGLSYYVEIIKDSIMNRSRFVAYDTNEEALKQFTLRFSRNKFDYVYGYTNALHHFAKYLFKQQIVLKDLCPTLKCVVVTSEQCFPEMRTEMEEAFGIPVYIEYGCSELGLIAMENSDQELLVCEAHVKLEVVNGNGELVEDGTVGYFLVTDLYNTAMPFIRYKLGDMGSVARNAKGEQLITNLQGRLNEQIVFPNGGISPGFTLYYLMKDVIEVYPSLSQYHIVQESNLELNFTFQFDGAKPTDLIALNKLVENLKDKYLAGIPAVTCQLTDLIAHKPSGKFKHFISKVNEA